jgi:hypothetical protein
MKHARQDYDRIQDPSNLIPKDEPVFLLRAKDKTAPAIVRAWANAQKTNPEADHQMIKEVEQHADVMEAYGNKHGNKWANTPKK